MSVKVSDVEDIISELGSVHFPWRLQRWLTDHASLPAIYHSVALRFDRESASNPVQKRIGRAESLFSTSNIAPEVVSQALDLYTQHGEWRQDELLARIQQQPGVGTRIEQITPPATSCIALNSYQRLFSYSQLGVEYALTRTEERSIYTYSLYLKRNAPLLTPKALRGLAIYGPLILILLSKHAQLAQPILLETITPKQVFSTRLTGCGVHLSVREYETCLGVLNGESIAQLALRMNVKQTSVRTYLDRALTKLHLSDKSGLYQWCITVQLPVGERRLR